jgi:hypothetical protein
MTNIWVVIDPTGLATDFPAMVLPFVLVMYATGFTLDHATTVMYPSWVYLTA